MTTATSGLRPGLGLLAASLLLASAAPAKVLFEDSFDSNEHQWRLDDQWSFHEGALVAKGVAEQVLVVGCDGPPLTDFRARLTARPIGDGAGEANYGYGLVYRFNSQQRDGYFLAVHPKGTYGFGKIVKGAFALQKRGVDPRLQTGRFQDLSLTVKGQTHELAADDVVVGTWLDGDYRSGGFGLLVVDQLTVAFEHLLLATVDVSAARTALGPFRPEPQPEPDPATPAPAGAYLGTEDLYMADEWRRDYSRMAQANGLPPLPATMDAVDVAVLGFLKFTHVTRVCPPAENLARLLADRVMTDAGATGPGPQAAVEFWLDYASAPADPELVGGQEDLLAGLMWYFVKRARTAAAWGQRGDYPLVVDNALRQELTADRLRFETAVPDAEARSGKLTELLKVSDQIRRLTEQLSGAASQP